MKEKSMIALNRGKDTQLNKVKFHEVGIRRRGRRRGRRGRRIMGGLARKMVLLTQRLGYIII